MNLLCIMFTTTIMDNIQVSSIFLHIMKINLFQSLINLMVQLILILYSILFILKDTKIVLLEELAATFQLKTQDAIDRLQKLVQEGEITGKNIASSFFKQHLRN